VPFALTIVALGLLYYALPNQQVRAGDAAIGGLVAGILFELTKRAFGLYVTHIGAYHAIYGAFATVPIFLMWVYLSWLVVLMGAVLVAVIPAVRADQVTAAAADVRSISASASRPSVRRPPARRGPRKRGGSPRGDRTSSG
jgi:uncharacterized BrkB/YihY/UPF0761 family membrane protein